MVLVITAYEPRAISGGTICVQQGIGGANKVPLMDKGSRAVLGICMKILTNDMSFHSRSWDSGLVGMSNVLSHDGDRILV